MAGEWLKLEASTPEKQEVFSITVAMGWTDPDLTVGKLFKVWRWFDQQTIDGNAPRVTLSLLDHIVGVSGFSQAMCDAGWLVCGEAGVSLPNFDRHNGKTAKERALTAKRVAKHKTNATANDAGNGASVSGALPREEKKREYKEEPKPLGAGAPGGVERRQGELEAIEDALPGEVDAAQQAAQAAAAGKPEREEYPADFEAVWALYPARHGGNPKKDAFKHWNARRREGVTAEEMQAGVERYAAHMKATGKVGTEYVMQAVRFFGTSKLYADPWPVAQPNATVPNRTNSRPSSNGFATGEMAEDDPFNKFRRAG